MPLPSTKPTATQVNAMRSWLVSKGVPAGQAALMAVAAKTRAEIGQALVVYLRSLKKAK